VISWKNVAAGGLTFLIAHAIEVEAWPVFDPAGGTTPWFLNAGGALAFTAAALLVIGFLSALTTSNRLSTIARGGSIAAGAIAAMTVVLFAKGPGTLFPIALAIGAAIAIASSISGAMLGRRLASAQGVKRT
jgi:hypothetical protein